MLPLYPRYFAGVALPWLICIQLILQRLVLIHCWQVEVPLSTTGCVTLKEVLLAVVGVEQLLARVLLGRVQSKTLAVFFGSCLAELATVVAVLHFKHGVAGRLFLAILTVDHQVAALFARF